MASACSQSSDGVAAEFIALEVESSRSEPQGNPDPTEPAVPAVVVPTPTVVVPTPTVVVPTPTVVVPTPTVVVPTPTVVVPTPTVVVPTPTPTQPYDPEEYFEVTFNGSGYICEEKFSWRSQYDCDRYFGGGPPLIILPSPDLYCSGPENSLTCDYRWYPDELADYELVTIDWNEYLCENSLFGSWGDKDCRRYDGGDPFWASGGSVDLYCSGSGYNMTCASDEYPSVWENYVVVRIDFGDYICDQGALFDTPCVRYFGGSPSQYSFFLPDYYCPKYGSTCERAR